jgi:superfamily II DNA or RNA helicase
MGFLTPARYYAPSTVDMKGVKIKCGDYDKTESDKRFNNKKIIGDVLENWLAKAEGRKTIVFSTSVKHSIAIKEAFLSAGISAEHLDANSTDEERQEVLYNFRHGELKVVTNCQLFTEGYDADFVGCIVLARATKSFPLYVQMVGRGQRIFPGKEDFFVFDHGGNIDRHGFISDPVTWSLDGKELAWKKPKKEKKEKKPVTCSACKLIFQGSICPDCGTEVQSHGKDVETIDAELEEIKPGKKATVADKRIFLGMLKHWVPRQKNPNPRRIKGIFRGKFGVWPHHSYEDVAPIEPDMKFLNMMKADQIRYAKRKQKELEAQK